jgi:hypothetical protein
MLCLQVCADEEVTHYYLPMQQDQKEAWIQIYTTDNQGLL